MGGGYYSGDVAERSRSTNTDHFVHTQAMRSTAVEERKCHRTLDPKNKIRECCDSAEHPQTTPIVIAMDLTRSRGKDARVVFGKLPMMIGQIILNDYIPDPELMFTGIGDATCDRAPLQVGQFESDNKLDDNLANMWLEEGGGGTGQESYELAAYYLARRTKLDCWKRGKKGTAFIFADEGFYPTVSADHVRRIIGDDILKDIPSAKIFAELQEKYNVYVIFPRQSYEDRKQDIDEEIRQRVTAAGGLVEGVDIRFSLLWNNRNDLDLHVQTPASEHIFFGNKIARCGGFLDVDMNVRGETTKPVENTRWEKSRAREGTYKVWVENYRFHESNHGRTEFRAEVEINGEVQRFEGVVPANSVGQAILIGPGTFTFDTTKRVKKEDTSRYDGYNDETIKSQWTSVIPAENFLMIDDPKACVDIMLGVIAITSGKRTLAQYLEDMKTREQSEKRIKEVKVSLTELGQLAATQEVNLGALAERRPTRRRAGSSKRL